MSQGRMRTSSPARMPVSRWSLIMAATCGRDEGQDDRDVEVGDGPDRFGFAGLGAAEGEAGDGLQAVVDGWRDQFLGHGPLEHPLDPADAAC